MNDVYLKGCRKFTGEATNLDWFNFSGKEKKRLEFAGDKTKRFAIAIFRTSKICLSENVATDETWVKLRIQTHNGKKKCAYADISSIANRFSLTKSQIIQYAKDNQLENELQKRVNDYQAIQEFAEEYQNQIKDNILIQNFDRNIKFLLEDKETSEDIILEKIQESFTTLKQEINDPMLKDTVGSLSKNFKELITYKEKNPFEEIHKYLEMLSNELIGQGFNDYLKWKVKDNLNKLSEKVNDLKIKNLISGVIKSGLPKADNYKNFMDNIVKKLFKLDKNYSPFLKQPVREKIVKTIPFGDLKIEKCSAKRIGDTIGKEDFRLKLVTNDELNIYAIKTDGYIYTERPEVTKQFIPYSTDEGKTWVLLDVKSLIYRLDYNPLNPQRNIDSETYKQSLKAFIKSANEDKNGVSLKQSINHNLSLKRIDQTNGISFKAEKQKLNLENEEDSIEEIRQSNIRWYEKQVIIGKALKIEANSLDCEETIRLNLVENDSTNRYAIKTKGSVSKEQNFKDHDWISYSPDKGKNWVLLEKKSLALRLALNPNDANEVEQIVQKLNSDFYKDKTGERLKEYIDLYIKVSAVKKIDKTIEWIFLKLESEKRLIDQSEKELAKQLVIKLMSINLEDIKLKDHSKEKLTQNEDDKNNFIIFGNFMRSIKGNQENIKKFEIQEFYNVITCVKNYLDKDELLKKYIDEYLIQVEEIKRRNINQLLLNFISVNKEKLILVDLLEKICKDVKKYCDQKNEHVYNFVNFMNLISREKQDLNDNESKDLNKMGTQDLLKILKNLQIYFDSLKQKIK